MRAKLQETAAQVVRAVEGLLPGTDFAPVRLLRTLLQSVAGVIDPTPPEPPPPPPRRRTPRRPARKAAPAKPSGGDHEPSPEAKPPVEAPAPPQVSADFVPVAKKDEVAPGTGRVVEAGGRQVALFNVDGSFHAVSNQCLHRGGPLGEGDLEGTIVRCPWHGWTYDVTTGVAQRDEGLALERFGVRVDGDDVLLRV